MDSLVETEELPYIVWYQCRMCTHLFFDDVEKMLKHLDTKHGAMIDCDEIRSLIYKNGLVMGGLPRLEKSKRIKSEDMDEYVSSPPVAFSGDEEDCFVKLQEPKSEVKALEVDQAEVANGEYDGYDEQNGDYEDEEEAEDVYEESAYDNTIEEENNSVEGSNYAYSVNDDEEQLPEGEFEIVEKEEENIHDAETQDIGELLDSANYGEEYQGDFEEDQYFDDEEDEDVSAEQSYNEDDLDEQFEIELEREEVEGHHEVYPAEMIQTHGVMSYGFTCKFCGKFFTTGRGVESHEQHHKSQPALVTRRHNESKVFPCRICKNKTFSSFKDLKSHVKSHAPDRIHICKFCFSTFNNTASLTKHLTIHKRENPNKCFCGKTFVSANTLKIHKKIHTGIKPFVCDFFECGRAFVTKSTLESHLRTHTGEKPYQCGYCPSSFTTSSAKYRHERHVHKIAEPGSI